MRMNANVLGSRVAVLAAILSVAPLTIGAVGCGDQHVPEPEAANGLYSVALTAATPASLPACTLPFAGNVAYVMSPPGLWSCIARNWVPIPCVTALAGAVAYSSTTKTLWACVASTWTQIALPAAGADGAPGANGTNGHDGAVSRVSVTRELPGANCVAGGVRIEVGIDTSSDGVLQSTEIQDTAYVCDGVASGQGQVDAGSSDAGSSSDGGAEILAAAPVLSPASSIDFGRVLCGTAGQTRTVTIQNRNAFAINFTARTTGAYRASPSGGAISAGAQVAVDVTLIGGATSVPMYEGTLVIDSDVVDDDGQTISLAAAASGAILKFYDTGRNEEISTLDLPVGQGPPVELRNEGDESAWVQLGVTGSPFYVTPTVITAIDPKEALGKIYVTFRPQAKGTFHDAIRVDLVRGGPLCNAPGLDLTATY